MKKLIINADDFGISQAANLAIDNCYRKGAIDSASVMVNMPFFEEAVDLVKSSKMPVGLHFNLTLGKPLSEGAKSLVSRSGHFYSRRKFVQRYFFGLIRLSDIKKEFIAQLDELKKRLPVDHIDSHQHIHMLPKLFDCLAQHCVNNNYPLRLTRQFFSENTSANKKFRAILLARLVDRAEKKWTKILVMNNCLSSVFDVLQADKKPSINLYNLILENLPVGSTELMVHPVLEILTLEEKSLTRIIDTSTKEYEILMSEEFSSSLLKIADVQRTTYGELKN